MRFVATAIAGVHRRGARGVTRTNAACSRARGVARSSPPPASTASSPSARISRNIAPGRSGHALPAAPYEEAKLVRCTRGAIFDVAVDLRLDSPTHGTWFGAELDPESAAGRSSSRRGAPRLPDARRETRRLLHDQRPVRPRGGSRASGGTTRSSASRWPDAVGADISERDGARGRTTGASSTDRRAGPLEPAGRRHLRTSSNGSPGRGSRCRRGSRPPSEGSAARGCSLPARAAPDRSVEAAAAELRLAERRRVDVGPGRARRRR